MRFLRHVLPALIITLLPMAARADGALPRIFFTPAERSAIARNRLHTAAPMASGHSVDPEAFAEASRGDVLRLDGVSVTRTGTRFAWIGGRRHVEGDQLGIYKLRISTTGVSLVTRSGTRHFLRVGETLGTTRQTSGQTP
jgi:hypothetical protein